MLLLASDHGRATNLAPSPVGACLFRKAVCKTTPGPFSG
jgi:hypothetical protein